MSHPGSYFYSSSRPCPVPPLPGSSASLERSVLLGLAIPALARIFASAAAIRERIRPSSASLLANRDISASYSSHSGICRALANFGSFYNNGQWKGTRTVDIMPTVRGFWQRSIVLARWSLSLLPANESGNSVFVRIPCADTYTMFHTVEVFFKL